MLKNSHYNENKHMHGLTKETFALFSFFVRKHVNQQKQNEQQGINKLV